MATKGSSGVLAATSSMIPVAVLALCMRTLTIRAQQGWRSFFFNDVFGQSPENNTYAALAILFFWWKSIDAVLKTKKKLV